MFNGNGNYGGLGSQANSYNENEIHRLSNVVEGEDPIAQAMGMQQQPQPQQQTQYRNDVVYKTQRQSQQLPQINANGKTISIEISPDGTITITIN